MAKLPKVDVVTVGAGWTGGILAQQLTAAGKTVVSIEQGPLRTTESNFAHPHDELRYQVRRDMMVDLSQETWTWRPDPNSRRSQCASTARSTPAKGLAGQAFTGPRTTGASIQPTSNIAATIRTGTARRGSRKATAFRTGR